MKEGKEAKVWAEVTPEMMSEEEFVEEENVCLRHPPSHRSGVLNKFIERLDMRVEATIIRVNPRIERRLGSSKTVTMPKFAKPWTIKKSCNGENSGGVLDIDLTNQDMNYDSDSSYDDIVSQYKPGNPL